MGPLLRRPGFARQARELARQEEPLEAAYRALATAELMSQGVTYALIAFKGGTALEVRLDRAWLDDPARRYPVTVDPEIHNTTAVFQERTQVWRRPCR